jgi:tRNA modification GTPase
MNLDDTIAAIASAPGGSWRGIVRMSGPDVVACLSRCFRGTVPSSLAKVCRPQVIPGHLSLTPRQGALPCDLFLWPSNRSYTRQPAAEIHTVGSPPLLNAALETVCRYGARLAEPGEFTMRAFLAGRLDLTQAEAVLGVIDARDRNQLDVALTQLAGGLTGPLDELRNELLELLAHLEAGLDFVEEDIEFVTADEVLRQLDRATRVITRLRDRMTTRDAEIGEPRVVLVGRPNVGKSSLLNALAGGQAALVAGSPGTTRDYLTCRLELDGLPCLLVDTAGVDEPAHINAVAVAAQRRTASQDNQANVRVLCFDVTNAPDEWERNQIELHGEREDGVVALTKCDLLPTDDHPPCFPPAAIRTSSRTGEGVSLLAQAIRRWVETEVLPDTNVVAGTAIRCRDSLRLAEDSLLRGRFLTVDGRGEELVAAEVRTALTELGKVVGAVYTDDVLERIFSRFCVGK